VDALLYVALNNAAWSAALALAAAAGARIWRRRPAVVHALWLLVLLKLAAPSLTQFPLPRGAVPRAAVPELVVPIATNRPAAVHEPTSILPVDPVVLASTADAPPRREEERDILVPPGEPGAVTVTAAPWPWRAVLAAVWLTGAAAWWSFIWLATARFHRLIGSARPAPTETSQRLAALAGRSGLRHVPTAWIVSACVSPMLWVPLFGRPRLVLPEELWGRLDVMQQDAILIHELMHLKRRDHWVRRVEAAVLGLYWWNPVAWWARRELERAEEECCDAWVVELLPSAVGAYADALVTTAVYLSGARRPLPLGASSVGRLGPIKRRLQMILSDASNVPVARTAPRALLILGMLSLPLMPAATSGNPPRVLAQEPTPREKPAADKPAERSSPSPTNRQPEPNEDRKAESPKKEPSRDQGKIRVQASQPLQREVRDSVELPGQVESVMTVSVRPRVSGFLINVNGQPGQKVRRGELLFIIDPRPYKAELEKAEAEVRVAKARFEAKRSEAMWAERATAKDREQRGKVAQLRVESKAAEASVEAAEKSLEIAGLNLQFTQLQSPIDGTILGPVVQAGNVAVADTTNLATIVSTDPMYVYFDVPQNLVLKLNRQRLEGKIKLEPGKGLPVRVGVADENDFPRQGTVDSLNGAVDPGTGAARWRAKVGNRDELLLPGMFARIRLPIGEPHKTLLIPEEVFWTDADVKYVIVVSDDGVIQRRAVTLGANHDGLREVKEGLEANEWVVGSLQAKLLRTLRGGSMVEVEKVPMPDGSSSGKQRLQ
jgi:multidrug efflux system membrane fusion protein